MAATNDRKDDPSIDEFEAFIEADRQRERDKAAQQADLEDAQAAAKEGHDMAAIDNVKDMRVRAEVPDGTYNSPSRLDENDPDYNPYLALAGIFEDDPFADEVDAYVQTVRQRQRDEAAAAADREDATGTIAGIEGHDMTAINKSSDARAEEPNGVRPRRPRQGENDPDYNPYLAFAGIFKDDPFIDELEAFIEAERQRQRDEAAADADREDAVRAAGEAE